VNELAADRAAPLVELLVRPCRFFPKLLAARGDRLPLLVIWIAGAGGVADKLDGRMLMDSLRRDSGVGRANLALDHWGATWGSVIGGGLLAGLLAWLVMGWWFRMRLAFCGAHPPKRAARNVFIHARSIAGAASLILLALATPFHASYRDAWSTQAVALGWSLLPLWSVWIGHRGVVSCFDVRPVAARVWFLILPLVLYGGILVLGIAIGVIASF
jgi:hypothetical protein